MSINVSRAFALEPYDYGEARALMAELQLAEPVAVTLVRRGYRTAEQARAFLEASDDHDPYLFDSMAEIVARIEAAIEAGRRITVHGDYDVDGVCSTALLVNTLRELGADCDWLIPGRLEDGYGLTGATIAKLAARGTSLLITTDCGIGSAAEVEGALSSGIEVIVTDHHQRGGELPPCPILHPSVSGYPFEELCATGVVYKLAVALRGAEASAGELDLVALATVADLVALRGENRALVRRGLAEARRAARPGLRALMASSSVTPERLDERDVAFRLAPRINAAGRLYRADAGVELMLTADPDRAAEIATELERANRERREVEREVLEAAERARGELSAERADAAGLVLAGQGWHPGVVGIVASRLVERHYRPVVLIGLDGDGNGRGSGRSIPGFDLLAALDACADHLERHGGHRAAAGLEIKADQVEGFQDAFAAQVEATISEAARTRIEPVDAVVGAENLGLDVAEQLTRLGPFGNGNPGVRLLVPSARLADVRPMGEGDRHARFSLRSGSSRATGVAFGVGSSLASAQREGPVDVSLKLELNEWNGAVEPRVVLGEIYLPVPAGRLEQRQGPAERIGEDEFWRRFDVEQGAKLGPPPAPGPRDGAGRETLDRIGSSGVATVAALASAGETVLAVCADAVRRRELVERAARPARFGGGELAIVSSRLPDELGAAARRRVAEAGAGVVLADWAALEREPGLEEEFEHLVVIDPAPCEQLERRCKLGSGYLHRVDGIAEAEFALRAHAEQWPSRATLAAAYRALRARGELAASLPAPIVRAVLCEEGLTHPQAPEVAARSARVLADLDLLAWEGSGTARTLGVVSSGNKDLDRSPAFAAYRDRYEDGKRFLNRRRQRVS